MSEVVPILPRASAPPTRSYLRVVISQAMRRWGARLGAVWIGLMALAAVLAPFVANSHPLLLKQEGQWSSPLLAHLTVNDVLILLAAVLAIGLACFRRIPLPYRALTWVVLMGVALPASWCRDTLVPFVTSRSLSLVGEPLSWPVWSIVALGFVIYAAVLVWVIVAWLRRAELSRRFKIAALTLGAIIALWLILWPIRPPLAVIHEIHREHQAQGLVEWQLPAPLPFSPSDRLRDQPGSRLQPPSLTHPLGTTNNGADLASNMIYATRIALSIGFISTGIAVSIGIVVGGLMGYFAGWVDLLGMRLVEIFSAIPTFILLLTFVAAFGANLYIMMVIIGLTGWVGDAIFIRAEFLRLRRQDFVQAAIATGLPLRSVLFRHMLPNGIAPVLVSASFSVAGAILAESTLSFLGIGLREEASWGRLLNDARGSGGTFYWWLALYPGLAIFLTVLAYNLVGEALRDAIDPHLQKAAQI